MTTKMIIKSFLFSQVLAEGTVKVGEVCDGPEVCADEAACLYGKPIKKGGKWDWELSEKATCQLWKGEEWFDAQTKNFLESQKLPEDLKSYYKWTWGSGSDGPADANSGVSFSGHSVVQDALDNEKNVSDLEGMKFITLGGTHGDKPDGMTKEKFMSEYTATGDLTEDRLKAIIKDINKITYAGYSGVIFDIETAVKGTIPQMKKAFKAAKEAGLKVGVTTSRSGPYAGDADTAVEMVKSWVKDTNLDFISPQLYGSGKEDKASFAETWACKNEGCTWDQYKNMKPRFIPSIVEASHYAAAKKHFKDNYSIKSTGYIQWAQVSRRSLKSEESNIVHV